MINNGNTYLLSLENSLENLQVKVVEYENLIKE